METTDLSSAPTSGSCNGSTSMQDEPVPRCYVPLCGIVFYVMAFGCFFSSLILRSGLSVAIVAMVNQTTVTDEDVVMSNVTEDQCPRDPELQYEDGELNWNRNQQGTILAAFYYGLIVTQVYASIILRPRARRFSSAFVNHVLHGVVVPTFFKSSPILILTGRNCRIQQPNALNFAVIGFPWLHSK